MSFDHAYVFPILVGVWYPFTFIVTYVIAVLNKDVLPVFPYISDTGNWSPESCIFGLMLTVGAIFMLITMYIRYRHVGALCEKHDFPSKVKKYNTITHYLGIVAVFGIIVVACFQETNVFVVHIMGAGTCFGLGTLYQCIQTWMSFKMYPTIGSKCINIMRVCCAVICTITLNATGITAAISLLQFTGKDITKWSSEEGGYVWHLISACNEWILAIMTMIFITTLSKEFRNIQVHQAEVTVKEQV